MSDLVDRQMLELLTSITVFNLQTECSGEHQYWPGRVLDAC